MKRRDFLKTCAIAGAGTALAGAAKPKSNHLQGPFLKRSKNSKKVIVLGLDGMDPNLTQQMMKDGDLPNFSKLAASGHFSPLGTTLPPQSPVAWSSFITGSNPGGHGIYDFIHRDPETLLPYLSTSKSIPGGSNLEVGKYVIPLESGRVDLMRHGEPFWKSLEANDIPSVIHALPGNFPVVPEGNVHALSGMGTPDLRGGYGTYTYFSERPVPGSRSFTGGKVERISMRQHWFESEIGGPQNPFVKGAPETSVPIAVYRDPVSNVARVDLGGEKIVLREGEWSDWIPLRFTLLNYLASTAGMVRIYLKQVHPYFTMYVTPVQIDPTDPALPICSPEGFSQELAERVGRFYTQGLPADTKALNEGVLTSEEFFEQAKIVLQESLDLYEYQLEKFNDGCFVFYFSSIDQNCHMLWRLMDPTHPLYDDSASKEVKDAIRYYYRSMDEVVRKAMAKADSNTDVIALSDHGFTTFTREFNLNTWLYENDFLKVTHPEKVHDMNYFDHVDWSKTQAYGVGINGLYLNLTGREKHGSVSKEQAARIRQDVAQKLLEIRDPKTGSKVIRTVYEAEKAYSGPYVDQAPDLLIGYEKGYRVSDESILGQFPKGIIGDRTKMWSADHCMDPEAMPGVLFSNMKSQSQGPAIWDLAPTILSRFGVKAPSSMHGKVVLA